MSALAAAGGEVPRAHGPARGTLPLVVTTPTGASIPVPTDEQWERMPWLARSHWARLVRRTRIVEIRPDADPAAIRHLLVAIARRQAKDRSDRAASAEAQEWGRRRWLFAGEIPRHLRDQPAWRAVLCEMEARSEASPRYLRTVHIELDADATAAHWTLPAVHGAQSFYRTGDRSPVVVEGHRIYERLRGRQRRRSP